MDILKFQRNINHMDEDQVNSELGKFMSDSAYKTSIVNLPATADHQIVIAKLKTDGYEVFHTT
jgi:hypothetical protein